MNHHFQLLDGGEVHANTLIPSPPKIHRIPAKYGMTELIMGCMFSGKTELGFQLVRSAIIGGKRAAIIKHTRDVRYNKNALASSHDGNRMRAIVAADLEQDPVDLPEDVELVFVDEGQWFKGLLGFCLRQNKRGRDVIVAALNSYADETRSGWPHVMELVPRATRITTLNGTCTLCHGAAECSRRIAGVPSADGVLVGADDKYIATCAGCYTEPIPEGVLERRAKSVEYVRWLGSE